MYERISLLLGRLMTADLKREDGQGTTEYAMVIGFVVVTLTITLGLMGTAIVEFLERVALELDGLVP
jgi:Flp pilus assembly pilin Flp